MRLKMPEITSFIYSKELSLFCFEGRRGKKFIFFSPNLQISLNEEDVKSDKNTFLSFSQVVCVPNLVTNARFRSAAALFVPCWLVQKFSHS